MSQRRRVEIDLHRDLVAYFRLELTQLGYIGANEPDDKDIPIIYFDVCKRLVVPKARRIHKSKGFSCPTELQSGLVIIERKLLAGQDITPHFSKTIKRLDYNDPMLNDWGIHHLHLGDNLESDGFISRTGPLLYCRFDRDDAYFIDVLSHGNWTTQTLLTTIHENWPETIGCYRICGVKGSKLSDEDIRELRRKNINYCLEQADGTTYAPTGGGTAGSGSSALSVRSASQLRRLIEFEENRIVENVEKIAEDALGDGISLPDPARFELQHLDGKFYGVERASGITVCLKFLSEKL